MRKSIGVLEDVKWSNMFSSLLQDAIMTTTGFYIEECALENEIDNSNEIVGAMVMCGEKSLILTVSTDNLSAKNIVSYMTGIDLNDLTKAMLCDGITEIVNIVGGGARIAFENTELAFSMTVPFTIIGEDINIIVKKRTERMIKYFCGSDIKLHLKIFEL